MRGDGEGRRGGCGRGWGLGRALRSAARRYRSTSASASGAPRASLDPTPTLRRRPTVDLSTLRTQGEAKGAAEYGYDAFGNATSEKHTTAAGVVRQTATVYDSLARPTSQSDPKTSVAHTWTYPLDEPGGVSETLTCGIGTPTATTISQDAAGLETKRSSDIGSGTPLLRTVDERDEAERVTAATVGGAPASHRSFDEADRLTRQWGAGFAAGAADTDAYLYDPDTGHKTADHLQLALGGSIDASYSYSAAARLKTATIDGQMATHTFDAAGNLKKVVEGATTTTFAYDTGNRLNQMDRTSGSSTHSTYFQWDAANGRRTVQGPSPTSKQITFAYTGTGRLARYANSASGVSASYQYDAAGQRTKSIVSQSGLTTTTTWTYEDITLFELSASRSDGASWRITYLYDEDGLPYAGIYREPANSSSPVVFSMVTSDRGDVVELLDEEGHPFVAYRYDAWGNPKANVSSATSLISTALAQTIASRQVLRYASYCWDAESKLCYCSARSYDPGTRQWISKDPEGADEEESAYQYCSGDPVGDVDFSGEKMYTVPNVRRVPQKKSMWCWAASAVCVVRAKSALDFSQREWVDMVQPFLCSHPNHTGKYRKASYHNYSWDETRDWFLTKTYLNWAGIPAYKRKTPADWAVVVGKVKNKKPIIVRVKVYGGGNHQMVLYGAGTVSGKKTVKVMDPWPPRNGKWRTMSWDRFKNNPGDSNCPAGWHWFGTLTYIKKSE